jgi:hypothetical protein
MRKDRDYVKVGLVEFSNNSYAFMALQKEKHHFYYKGDIKIIMHIKESTLFEIKLNERSSFGRDYTERSKEMKYERDRMDRGENKEKAKTSQENYKKDRKRMRMTKDYSDTEDDDFDERDSYSSKKRQRNQTQEKNRS